MKLYKKLLSRIFLLTLLFSLIGQGCNGDKDSETIVKDVEKNNAKNKEEIVFAVISDPHMQGDMNDSRSQKLVATLEHLAGLNPIPEFVSITGDVIDGIQEPPDLSEGSRIVTLKNIIDNSPFPIDLITGNHDYDSNDSLLTDDRNKRDELFKDQFGINPYYSVKRSGVKFIYVNGMYGDLWDKSMGQGGSVGEEQLNWLSNELSEGLPSAVFLHHPPHLLMEPEGQITFSDVILANTENVLIIFAGHFHFYNKSEMHGIPVYLTDDLKHEAGPRYHHVRINSKNRTVEILNEDEIGYTEMNASTCDPGEYTPIGNLGVFNNTIQELVLQEAESDAPGVGSYLADGVKQVAFLLALNQFDQSQTYISSTLSGGKFVSEEETAEETPVEENSTQNTANADEQTLPDYVAKQDGVPCFPLDIIITDPCFETIPVDFEIDLRNSLPADVLEEWQIKDEWEFKADLKNLHLTGLLDNSGETPHIENGIFSATVDITKIIIEIKNIFITEYCAGNSEGCEPGSEGIPACPQEVDIEFFEQIPEECEVDVANMGLRVVLMFLNTVPGGKANVTATFNSFIPVMTKQSQPGGADPAILECK